MGKLSHSDSRSSEVHLTFLPIRHSLSFQNSVPHPNENRYNDITLLPLPNSRKLHPIVGGVFYIVS